MAYPFPDSTIESQLINLAAILSAVADDASDLNNSFFTVLQNQGASDVVRTVVPL